MAQLVDPDEHLYGELSAQARSVVFTWAGRDDGSLPEDLYLMLAHHGSQDTAVNVHLLANTTRKTADQGKIIGKWERQPLQHVPAGAVLYLHLPVRTKSPVPVLRLTVSGPLASGERVGYGLLTGSELTKSQRRSKAVEKIKAFDDPQHFARTEPLPSNPHHAADAERVSPVADVSLQRSSKATQVVPPRRDRGPRLSATANDKAGRAEPPETTAAVYAPANASTGAPPAPANATTGAPPASANASTGAPPAPANASTGAPPASANVSTAAPPASANVSTAAPPAPSLTSEIDTRAAATGDHIELKKSEPDNNSELFPVTVTQHKRNNTRRRRRPDGLASHPKPAAIADPNDLLRQLRQTISQAQLLLREQLECNDPVPTLLGGKRPNEATSMQPTKRHKNQAGEEEQAQEQQLQGLDAAGSGAGGLGEPAEQFDTRATGTVGPLVQQPDRPPRAFANVCLGIVVGLLIALLLAQL